jgi:23S rRNA pseudouridine1911/1915/1917 synthase
MTCNRLLLRIMSVDCLNPSEDLGPNECLEVGESSDPWCEYVLDPLSDGDRLDKVLTLHLNGQVSRQQLQKSFEQQQVLLNGVPVSKDCRAANGGVLRYRLIDLVPTELKPIDLEMTYLFEDEHIVVVDKPAGLVVYPGHGKEEVSVVQAVLSHCPLSAASGKDRPGIVHRLDKETSGVMVLAKTDKAYHKLVKLFAAREIKKIYWALVKGIPRLRSGVIQLPIMRHSTVKTKMMTHARGLQARTDWVIETTFQRCSLLRCTLHSGRTHQIRVHLSAIGHPVVGDREYGYGDQKLPPTNRFFLHAHILGFSHPLTHQPLTFTSELPEDFKGYVGLCG